VYSWASEILDDTRWTKLLLRGTIESKVSATLQFDDHQTIEIKRAAQEKAAAAIRVFTIEVESWQA
jgi:hypothetical protein